MLISRNGEVTNSKKSVINYDDKFQVVLDDLVNLRASPSIFKSLYLGNSEVTNTKKLVTNIVTNEKKYNEIFFKRFGTYRGESCVKFSSH